MTKEELMAEEHICNGKCQDDITRNYVHCKTCTRLKDFLAGYKAGKADLEKENAELKKQLEMSNKVYNDNKVFRVCKMGLSTPPNIHKSIQTCGINFVKKQSNS